MRTVVIIVLILFACQITAQTNYNQKKLIHTIELSFQYGLGGGTYGLQLKVNHWWKKNGTFILQSGLSLDLFRGSENGFLPPNTSTKGYNFDTHIRFYTGVQQHFSKKEKGFYNFELYGGGYHIYTKGNVKHHDLNVNSGFKSNKILGDFGIRIGYGHQITEKLGTMFVINNSLRQINSDYIPFIRFLSMESDAKTSIGIGVNYGL